MSFSLMRSDFLGDCTQFAGLAEALNRSQYLIPRSETWRSAVKPVGWWIGWTLPG